MFNNRREIYHDKDNHELIEKYFDRVIFQDAIDKEENIRLFKDGGTGSSAYTPFVNKIKRRFIRYLLMMRICHRL